MTGVCALFPTLPSRPPLLLSCNPVCLLGVSPLLVTLLTLKWKLSFFPAFVSRGSSWGTPRTDVDRGTDEEGARDLHLQVLSPSLLSMRGGLCAWHHGDQCHSNTVWVGKASSSRVGGHRRRPHRPEGTGPCAGVQCWPPCPPAPCPSPTPPTWTLQTPTHKSCSHS